MRLTLRTLLAYLDDTLEPAQAKVIGQKVAESDTARELIERIKQVTRTRRLTAPPSSGSDGIDPNTIAEYLDNVAAEQSAEVEEICLSSDLHLAEVAACHQILTLILGEPALVPPTAKQRMYGLIKGPEAIPFRRPPLAQPVVEGEYPESQETDETLRLGLPPFRRHAGWKQRLLAWGGSVLAAALLVVALWQILGGGGGGDEDNQVAQNGGHKTDPQPDDREKPGPKKKDDKGPGPEIPDPKAKEAKEKEEKEKARRKDYNELMAKGATALGAKKYDEAIEAYTAAMKLYPEEPEAAQKIEEANAAIAQAKAAEKKAKEVLDGPPSPKQVVAGEYLPAMDKHPSLLVQAQEDGGWRRLVKQSPVWTGRPLVAFPFCRSEVKLKDLRLTLVGMGPEVWPLPPALESAVVLHEHPSLDLDLTLRRGRIVITRTGGERSARIRIRFANPTHLDQLAHLDLTLEGKGANVLVDRWSYFPFDRFEPFYKDPKHRNRVGPRAGLALIIRSGKATVKMYDSTYPTMAPPGGDSPSLLLWDSGQGKPTPQALLDQFRKPAKELPDFLSATPPLPPGIKPQQYKSMLRACETLRDNLAARDVEVGLTEALRGVDDSLRTLAVRCRGALDDYKGLVELLAPEAAPHVRNQAIDVLERWLPHKRENDYLLYEVLKEKYRREADKIIELLHGLSDRDVLKDYVENPAASTILREMAVRRLAILDAFKKAAGS